MIVEVLVAEAVKLEGVGSNLLAFAHDIARESEMKRTFMIPTCEDHVEWFPDWPNCNRQS